MRSTNPNTISKGKIIGAIFLLLLTACCSCKKNKDSIPKKNTEVKATVILPSGATITINATGSKAIMGSTSFGGGTYIDGTNESNAAVYTTTYDSLLQVVSSPGTYNYFSCEYRVDVTSASTPIYENLGSNPGSITFTKIDGHYMEGYFNSVCWSGSDSVIVSGTFKGEY